jgi:hypothetical protein
MTDDPTNEPTNDPTNESTEPLGIPAESVNEGPPPWQAQPAPAAASAPPGPPNRSGVVVPIWALLTVAGLLVFGLGLLGGWAIASRDDDHDTISSRDLRELAPFGGQNGAAGNGRDADRWDSGNGNGSGNGSGNPRNAGVYLGVVPKDSTSPAGAAIVEVAPASPAERAGLENGDVITAVGQGAVRNASQLVRRVRAHDSGDKVTIAYTRDGASKTVQVTLGSRPQIGQLPFPDETPQSQS